MKVEMNLWKLYDHGILFWYYKIQEENENILIFESDVNSIVTSVTCAIGPSVTTSSTDFSFQNLAFWNLFEFSVTEIT